jgi:hypothetical protein
VEKSCLPVVTADDFRVDILDFRLGLVLKHSRSWADGGHVNSLSVPCVGLCEVLTTPVWFSFWRVETVQLGDHSATTKKPSQSRRSLLSRQYKRRLRIIENVDQHGEPIHMEDQLLYTVPSPTTGHSSSDLIDASA